MDRRPHPKKRVPLSGPMVREKAKYLYAHFKEPDGSCSVKIGDKEKQIVIAKANILPSLFLDLDW
uniref:Uncharacterized protein n=1 Tax=Rhodnius prolixus TaxID=13249 RepID=T1I5V5_RHOPR